MPDSSLAVYVGILRRQFPIVILVFSICLVFGLLYLLTALPRFTSTASLVIDTRKVQLFQQQSVLGDIPIDSATVETQIEVLKSENIGLAVVKDLHLTEDPEFVSPGGGLIGAILGSLPNPFARSNASSKSELDLARGAVGVLNQNRAIRRLGLTYVMEISYTSLDPEKASRIANAIADAYIVDQLEAKYQATRRASMWLQDRIAELRTQASSAQRAVVDFKQRNNIVDAGGGRLMNEQQLAEVNSQLIIAKAATAEASARLSRINDILKQEIPDASVADALKNETIVKLRGQYVDFASRESTWSAKYGRDHLAAVNLRIQMQEIKKNITEELKRIQQSYKSDFDIAKAREESIRGSLANVVSEAQSTNQAQVQLRELESTAQSYQTMYDNFLQRYMESVQQQSFPITEARLISPASRPTGKSAPKTSLVLAGTVAAGLMLGFLAAMAREFADKGFRTSNQVEEYLKTLCIAMIPSVRLQPAGRGMSRAGLSGKGSSEEGLLRYVIESPISRFSEAVRSMKVTLDLSSNGPGSKIVALTSAIPNEGKTTVSANFAQLIAHSGGSALLIDGDLRNPGLSRLMAPKGAPGLVELIKGKIAIDDAIIIDRQTGLSFLPAGRTQDIIHSSELFSSKAMLDLTLRLRERFEYIVLDLPPMAPVLDARVTADYVDAYIFVVEWGKTGIDLVQKQLSGAPEVSKNLLGVVLNKTDTKLVGRYEAHQGSQHYNKYYARYGYVD